VIRYRLPAPGPRATVPALPEALARHVDAGELILPSADVTADLALLAGWARDNHVDLTGLEVGSPSLEDAYLALTADRQTTDREGELRHG
jgi:ABC-2 type transport system ATP-binding protein